MNITRTRRTKKITRTRRKRNVRLIQSTLPVIEEGWRLASNGVEVQLYQSNSTVFEGVAGWLDGDSENRTVLQVHTFVFNCRRNGSYIRLVYKLIYPNLDKVADDATLHI